MPTTGLDDLLDIEVRPETFAPVDALVVAGWQDEALPVAGLPDEIATAIVRLESASGWNRERGELVDTLGPTDDAGRIVLLGLGARTTHDARGDLALWNDVSRRLAKSRAETVGLRIPGLGSGTGEEGERLGRSLTLAQYRFDRFKAEKAPGRLDHVLVFDVDPGSAAAVGLSVGTRVATGVALARELANTPPNVATPAWMAARASALAGDRIEVEVIEPAELEERGMGGILAVGGGSRHSPRLVVARYRGAASPRVALVGKGVTFDTGGISIKPAKDMDEMKYDKCGACAVLGAMVAVAELELPLAIDAFVPLAENMPSGDAYRPGDIVTTYDGTTVEVLNTDAEGRMILADALALAAEGAPDVIVELSTLTGASVVALGLTGAALYTPDDELADELLAHAGRCGERLWRMPLWPEFGEAMKGVHADLRNVAGRWGGANTAAAFLSEFVGESDRWAHLDIAGPAAVTEGEKSERGATGYGVATITAWLRALAAR